MLTNVGETQLHFTKSRGYCQVFRQRIFAFVVKVVKPLIQFPSFDLQIKHSAANHHVTCAIFGVCYCLLAAMTPLKSPGKQGQGRTLSSADTSHIRGQRHTICFIITYKNASYVSDSACLLYFSAIFLCFKCDHQHQRAHIFSGKSIVSFNNAEKWIENDGVYIKSRLHGLMKCLKW